MFYESLLLSNQMPTLIHKSCIIKELLKNAILHWNCSKGIPTGGLVYFVIKQMREND